MIRIAKKWPNPFSEGENNLHLRSWNQIKRVAEISQPALSGATLKKKTGGIIAHVKALKNEGWLLIKKI